MFIYVQKPEIVHNYQFVILILFFVGPKKILVFAQSEIVTCNE